MLRSLVNLKRYTIQSTPQLLYQCSKKAKSPFFTLDSHHIEIIDDPLQFYLTINRGIKSSVHRIGLSSLYLGTGTLERFLLQNIKKRMEAIPEMQTIFLFDYNRSMREEKGQSSFDMIKNSFMNFDMRNFQVSFNRQSKKRNILGEINGVHHQKIYIFDDSVIIGGANLSHNYFLNRKDRYLHFKECPDFTDYLFDYLRSMKDNTYILKDDVLHNPKNSKPIQHYKLWKYSYTPSQFKDSLFEQEKYLNFLREERKKQIQSIKKPDWGKRKKSKNIMLAELLGTDLQVYEEVPKQQWEERKDTTREKLFTAGIEGEVGNALMDLEVKCKDSIIERGQKVYIFPFMQNPLMSESSQKQTFHQILQNSVDMGTPVRLSSGYMNLTDKTLNIMAKSQNPVQILCSAPEANSFFRGGRFKKYIPYFYRCFQGKILQQYPDKFEIQQFNNGKWSFHAKGMWLKENENNYLTIVGSSNFNRRSYERDSELQTYLYSTCPAFNKRLDQEWNNISENCKKVQLEDIKNDEEIKYSVFSRFFSQMFSPYL